MTAGPMFWIALILEHVISCDLGLGQRRSPCFIPPRKYWLPGSVQHWGTTQTMKSGLSQNMIPQIPLIYYIYIFFFTINIKHIVWWPYHMFRQTSRIYDIFILFYITSHCSDSISILDVPDLLSRWVDMTQWILGLFGCPIMASPGPQTIYLFLTDSKKILKYGRTVGQARGRRRAANSA